MEFSAEEGAQQQVSGSKPGITAAAMCGALMAILDIAIVNVGLTEIRASLGAALDQVSWVSTGYMMANVVVIPLTGWIQRRLGFRATYTAALLWFTAASALCGLAWDLPSLVAFRVLQGVGGGALIPTAQNLLLARYPRREHGLAGALFGLGAITGPLLGPTVGGYLIDVASWRWLFLVNLPAGLLSAGLCWRHVRQEGFAPGPRAARPREPPDLWGGALLAAALMPLQYVLEEGHRDGWWDSRTIVALTLVAGSAGLTFVVHELETRHPLVDLRVFAGPGYAGASALNFLIGVAAFSASYLFSLYCGVVMRYAAVDIGRVFLCAGAVQLVLMPLLGTVGARLAGRELVALGIGLTCAGLWAHGQLCGQGAFFDLWWPRFVLSVGLGFLYVPLSVLALSGLPPEQRGYGTGLFNLTRELGGSIGTAWMSQVLSDRGALHAARLAEGLWRPLQAQEALTLVRGQAQGRGLDPVAAAGGLLARRLSDQALVLAFDDAFLLVAGAFALSFALLPLLRRPGHK